MQKALYIPLLRILDFSVSGEKELKQFNYVGQ